jgi:hypothetical protein
MDFTNEENVIQISKFYDYSWETELFFKITQTDNITRIVMGLIHTLPHKCYAMAGQAVKTAHLITVYDCSGIAIYPILLKSLQELIKGAFTTGQCDWVK